MKQQLLRPAMAVLVCASLLAMGVQAQTGPADASATPAKTKSKKKSAGGQKMPKFLSGSQESVKERNTRLQRECRGATNAGACKGYTG